MFESYWIPYLDNREDDVVDARDEEDEAEAEGVSAVDGDEDDIEEGEETCGNIHIWRRPGGYFSLTVRPEKGV